MRSGAAGRLARRWVHLVLGGALLMPYFLFVGTVVLALLGVPDFFTDPPALALTVTLALPLVAVTALVPATRPAAVALARGLAGVAPDALAEGPARGPADRTRTACWYVLHLGLGAVVSGATLAVPPFAVLLLVLPLVRPEAGAAYALPGAGPAVLLAPPAGLALLAALTAVAAGVGALLARAAPVLLGPSPGERVERAERRAAELAVRNRLAREVHDSVGHALSAIALQATAARRLLDGPPAEGRAFAGEALAAIEETARRTVGELDAVLGVLRESGPDPARPAPGLADGLPALLSRTRAAGCPVTVRGAPPRALPPPVDREAYRIVQEGLANALKHAPGAPVLLRFERTAAHLAVRVSQPLTPALPGPPAGGGRGLAGIAERARLLGGAAVARPRGGDWVLDVALPTGSGPDPGSVPRPASGEEAP
ncbi:histidine kinase OS=Streptomyces gougerotii OX=53448 GN=GCM10010227_46210 PE=4 SV=1 [Streptomyces diastaticus subsp. diastaticus]|uniref:histidine kinase n=3 Tax=Streptomyces TaxID=1883 RepID=A0A380NDE0_STRGR|nr:Two-component system sensor histidine kinase [Streptomyces griseus]